LAYEGRLPWGGEIDVLLPATIVFIDMGADLTRWAGDENPPPYAGTDLIRMKDGTKVAHIPFGSCAADPTVPRMLCREMDTGDLFAVDENGRSVLLATFPAERVHSTSLTSDGPYVPSWTSDGQLVLEAEASDPALSSDGYAHTITATYDWPLRGIPAHALTVIVR
jgi:hypothetical protein